MVVTSSARNGVHERETDGQGSKRTAKRQKMATGDSIGTNMKQKAALGNHAELHEDDLAQTVIVCAPSLSKMMGALHPAAALYARPVHINQARDAHDRFVALLRRRGVETHDVRDILAKDAEWSVGDRVRLEELAAQCLTYRLADTGSEGDRTDESGVDSAAESSAQQDDAGPIAQHHVSEEYKKSVLAEMDVIQLVDIIMTNPTVTVRTSGRDTGYTAQYSFSPSTNIMFTRDQQITTARGVLMARLRSAQREKEVKVMAFCWEKLGVPVLGHVKEGFLEGGDFFPCGKDLCFVGVGTRSTYGAVRWIMRQDWFGTSRVVVVRDDFDKSQDRMHLDCVFNVIGRKSCVMLSSMIDAKPGDKSIRIADIWERRSDKTAETEKADGDCGMYRLARPDVEFSALLKEWGWNIVPITPQEQLEYGCNVLNLGNGRLISTEAKSARRVATQDFVTSVEHIDFSAVTAMYGGVHCASQVVHRSSAAQAD